LRVGFICLVGMLAMLCGCGREERAEAVRFVKVLQQQQAGLTDFVALENNFLDGARGWCAGVIANGAGKGDQLTRNAEIAEQLANSAEVLSAELGQIRQALSAETLKAEGARELRSSLIDQISQRQRYLQEVRTMFKETAPVFLQFKLDKAYAADTYPGGITQLNDRLQSYKGPAAVLDQAIADLKEKHGITDADLGA
jgi:hypothetical protein